MDDMYLDQPSTAAGIGAIINAAHFSADKHRDQRRKDAAATPYINHPLAVAAILANEVGIMDPDILVAAILHDTVEDTETSLDEIEQHFGSNVAKIVAQVTDDKSLPKLERKRLQIVNAAHKTPEAKLLKLADKIANLRDMANQPPADWSTERLQQYFDFAENVAQGLTGLNAAMDELFAAAMKRRPV